MLLKKSYTYSFNDRLVGKPNFSDIALHWGDETYKFWRQYCNIYFNRSYRTHFVTKTGNIIERQTPLIRKNRVLNALLRPHMRGGTLIMDLRPNNVIEILQNGAESSPGAYNPSLGIRMHKGIWAGIKREYWRQWDAIFMTVFILNMRNAEHEIKGSPDKVRNVTLSSAKMYGVTLLKVNPAGGGYVKR